MIRMKWAVDYWVVTIYDPVVALERFQRHKITIHRWQKRNSYTYSFTSSARNHDKIIGLFKELKLVHRSGLKVYGENLIRGRTTLVSIIFALLVFMNFSQRIDQVIISEINDVPLQNEIRKFLADNQVERFQMIIPDKTILKLERDLAIRFREKIEWVEIRRHGAQITVKVRKRATLPVFPDPTPQLLATKNGVIAFFRIKSGTIKVVPEEYVRQGQLLVDGMLTTPDGEFIYIGCEGSVYAYTWYLISVDVPMTISSESDKTEAFLKALDESRTAISYELTGDDEQIEKENILQITYEEDKIRMRVHYTLLEDITR